MTKHRYLVTSKFIQPLNRSVFKPMFYTKSGQQIPGITIESLKSLRSELQNEFRISTLQMAECAGYSFAMVVRHAIGSYAAKSRLTAIVDDSIESSTILATTRHLVNAGGQAKIITCVDRNSMGEVNQVLIEPLTKIGVVVNQLSSVVQSIESTINTESHAILFGPTHLALGSMNLQLSNLVEIINEATTPAHVVDLPLGLDPNNGEIAGPRIYAASTMSLGAPLVGLDKGHELVGRHFLCDLSIPIQLYAKYGIDIGEIFSEQPVVQITPATKES